MNSLEFENFLAGIGADFEIEIIGKSVLQQNIYAVKKFAKDSTDWCLVTGGIHAREHLSCDLICHFIEKARELPFNIAFVPLINPDGADLVCGKIFDPETMEMLKNLNRGSDFSLFKANARGVDLNNNFDANWQQKFSKATAPASQGFYGYSPMSEPETQALASFTQKIMPFLSLSYHLKGEEIYFDFFQDEERFLRDKTIAQIFANGTGYQIKSTQESSSGGFKDWCVQKLKIPALTIELGSDKFSHPFPKEQLGSIIEKNSNFFNDIQKSYQVFKALSKSD